MIIPNDPEKITLVPLDTLREFQRALEFEHIELIAKTKLVNDRIAALEEEERVARGPNPLGVAILGKR